MPSRLAALDYLNTAIERLRGHCADENRLTRGLGGTLRVLQEPRLLGRYRHESGTMSRPGPPCHRVGVARDGLAGPGAAALDAPQNPCVQSRAFLTWCSEGEERRPGRGEMGLGDEYQGVATQLLQPHTGRPRPQQVKRTITRLGGLFNPVREPKVRVPPDSTPLSGAGWVAIHCQLSSSGAKVSSVTAKETVEKMSLNKGQHGLNWDLDRTRSRGELVAPKARRAWMSPGRAPRPLMQAQPSSPCAVALAGPGRRLRRGVAQADPSSAAQHWRKVGEVPNTPSNTNSPLAMYTPTIPTASPWRYRRHSQALNASTGAFAPPRLPCECPRAPLAPHQLFISSLSALRWVNRHASPDSTPDLRSGWPCSSSARPKQAPRSEYHGARGTCWETSPATGQLVPAWVSAPQAPLPCPPADNRTSLPPPPRSPLLPLFITVIIDTPRLISPYPTSITGSSCKLVRGTRATVRLPLRCPNADPSFALAITAALWP
ncbi:hypothetical protein ACCO45_009086 [Purpureocillium lilacinum]|uniref:Uncharacterized protein n=1 Tax=Purpureocillium lilacinum TaxID=33203 RepID=A0ACC4DLM5_PURLI